jgi:hypothetical protein
MILIALMFLMITAIWAQEAASPREGFEGVQVSRAPEDLKIQIKAMMPDITIVQIKTDTYVEPGNYNFTVNLEAIQAESKKQLTNWQQEITKWLEESK